MRGKDGFWYIYYIYARYNVIYMLKPNSFQIFWTFIQISLYVRLQLFILVFKILFSEACLSSFRCHEATAIAPVCEACALLLLRLRVHLNATVVRRTPHYGVPHKTIFLPISHFYIFLCVEPKTTELVVKLFPFPSTVEAAAAVNHEWRRHLL